MCLKSRNLIFPSVKDRSKTKRHQSAKRNHPRRIPIPEHLEREEIVLDIPEEDKVCPETGKLLNRIGWEISEKLEYRPGKLIVNVYKKARLGPMCEGAMIHA
jgi:transposase